MPHRITTTCVVDVVEVEWMNQFVFNFANVIGFKSVPPSNIYYFYYEINKSSLVIYI
jgi:hypothetical protein